MAYLAYIKKAELGGIHPQQRCVTPAPPPQYIKRRSPNEPRAMMRSEWLPMTRQGLPPQDAEIADAELWVLEPAVARVAIPEKK